MYIYKHIYIYIYTSLCLSKYIYIYIYICIHTLQSNVAIPVYMLINNNVTHVQPCKYKHKRIDIFLMNGPL